VITAIVNHHVSLGRHVTVHALSPGRIERMKVVSRGVVSLGGQRRKPFLVRLRLMALHTERIATGAKG
jgi:hypothetical protein